MEYQRMEILMLPWRSAYVGPNTRFTGPKEEEISTRLCPIGKAGFWPQPTQPEAEVLELER